MTPIWLCLASLSLAAVSFAAADPAPATKPALSVPPGAELIDPPPPATRPTSRAAADRQTAETSAPAGKPDDKLDYLLALPDGYGDDPDKKWPLIVFLHGVGERGGDVRRVASWGPPKLINEGKAVPAIVVSPQCPQGRWWPHEVVALSKLLDHVEATQRVDPDRVYLTGLSMGGFGAVAWAAAEPQRFACLSVVCGGGDDPFTAASLSALPCWFFAGTADPVVKPQYAIDLYNGVKLAGGRDVRLTLYRGVGHESWVPAYGEQRLWDWMFAQKRGG